MEYFAPIKVTCDQHCYFTDEVVQQKKKIASIVEEYHQLASFVYCITFDSQSKNRSCPYCNSYRQSTLSCIYHNSPKEKWVDYSLADAVTPGEHLHMPIILGVKSDMVNLLVAAANLGIQWKYTVNWENIA